MSYTLSSLMLYFMKGVYLQCNLLSFYVLSHAVFYGIWSVSHNALCKIIMEFQAGSSMTHGTENHKSRRYKTRMHMRSVSEGRCSHDCSDGTCKLGSNIEYPGYASPSVGVRSDSMIVNFDSAELALQSKEANIYTCFTKLNQRVQKHTTYFIILIIWMILLTLYLVIRIIVWVCCIILCYF